MLELMPNMGARMMGYKNFMLMHGAYGKEYLSGTDSSTVDQKFRYLIFLGATIFSAITDNTLPTGNEDDLIGVEFPAGIAIPGEFVNLTLTSGKVLCIKDIPAEEGLS